MKPRFGKTWESWLSLALGAFFVLFLLFPTAAGADTIISNLQTSGFSFNFRPAYFGSPEWYVPVWGSATLNSISFDFSSHPNEGMFSATVYLVIHPETTYTNAGSKAVWFFTTNLGSGHVTLDPITASASTGVFLPDDTESVLVHLSASLQWSHRYEISPGVLHSESGNVVLGTGTTLVKPAEPATVVLLLASSLLLAAGRRTSLLRR